MGDVAELLAEEELVDIREFHVLHNPPNGEWCAGCGYHWPCDAVRLLGERDALLGKLERLRRDLALGLPLPEAS